MRAIGALYQLAEQQNITVDCFPMQSREALSLMDESGNCFVALDRTRLRGETDERTKLAHELGHFKHKHITKRMIGMFVLSLVGFAVLGWLSQQVWFYTGLGVVPSTATAFGLPAHDDALALLLFMLAMPVFTFWIAPLMAHFSRRDEFEADAYAMQQANGSALASALLKLYEDNASTLTPDPVYARYYYSHPPAVERLARMPQPATSNPVSAA